MSGKKSKPKRAKSKKKLLEAHVTHLRMDHPPTYQFPVPSRPTLALIKADNIPADYYRFLYALVGKAYHWQERRSLDDDALLDIINRKTTQIDVLYADGCPAGFFELDIAAMPECVEIVYFGLGQRYQGLGIGKWFLATAIRTAWNHHPEFITVHTNTLDHPAALPLYQKLGFEPVAVSDETIIPWE